MGISAPGNGLRQRHDLLAPPARLANRWRMAEDMARITEQVGHGRCHRLVCCGHGQLFRTRPFWGAKTGPNPTDRGKNGSKRHLIVDGRGTPLAIEHTGANVHDSEMAIPLVKGIPPIKQSRGRPRKRPDNIFADRAYDAEEKIRQPLRLHNVTPKIAKRNTEHGSGLGRFRYVVEAAFDWLFNQRRLRVRYEKRDDIHQAFLIIGCFLICWCRIMEFC
jgi:transposase